MVLRRVLVSGPITALAAASRRHKVHIFAEAHRQALVVDARTGPQGGNGSVNPLCHVNVEPYTKP